MIKRNKESSQKILVFCIFSSVLVHVVALGFLFYHFSFVPSGSNEIVLEESFTEETIDALEKQALVDVVFEAPVAAAIEMLSPKKMAVENDSITSFLQKPQSIASFSLPDSSKPISLIDPKENFTPLEVFSSLVTKEEVFTAELHDKWIEDTKQISLSAETQTELSAQLPESHPTPQAVEEPKFSFEKQFFPNEEKLGKRPTIFLGDLTLQKQLFVKGQKKKRKPFSFLAKPISTSSVKIPMPSLKELNTISCAEDFTYDLVYSKADEGDGYIFALTLLPQPSQNWKKMRQNFFFILDTSNSITEKRLAATRNAVSSCLFHLDKEDSFNILTFDHDLRFLFDGSSTPDRDSKKLAKSFLTNSQLGSFFSSATYHLPFEKIYSYPKREDEIHSIILLTNGDGLEKKKNYSFLKEWSKHNQGDFSLYSISLDNDPALGILDFFSSVNRGKMISVSTERGIRRQIQKLVNSIKQPIAKNVAASVYPQSTNKVHLSFPGGLKPHIFSDSPYVILGKISSLEDFDLFLQGRNADRYFNIKKKITFNTAKEGTRALHREWSLHKSYPMYQKFLYEGSLENLNEVKKLLSPYSLQTAF